MSDQNPPAPRGKTPKRSSSMVRSNNNDLSGSGSGHRGGHDRGPSSRMSAPSSGKHRPKRSQSFKRTSINHGAMAASAGMDLDALASMEIDSSYNAPMRSRSGRSDSRRGGESSASASARTSPSRTTTTDAGFGTTAFVKNFLEEDDHQDVLSNSQRLQFDAETQRNVHRSLLTPYDSSPGSSPEGPRKTIMSMGSSHRGRSAGAAPSQNLLKLRDDFYNVDQSVNLMDAEVGKYESKKDAARGPSSMVEIFLKDSGPASATASKSRHGPTLFPRPEAWQRMTTFEKVKDVASRLLIPVFCCCIFAVVISAIVFVYHTTAAIETAVAVLEFIEVPAVPEESVLNTEGMTEAMKAVSQALMELQVVDALALADPASAAFQALDWISNDEIALTAVPNVATRRLQQPRNQPQVSETQERMVQRYVLAVAYYSWNGMTAKADDLSAAALQNMDDLGASVQPQENMAHELWLSPNSECTWKGVECHPHMSTLQISSPTATNKNHEGTQIRALNLTHHGLQGTLPPQLTALRHMVELDLRHNSLAGNLDAIQWYNWDRMEYLLLGNNLFSGTVPNAITALERAIDIDLGDNQFTGTIPPLTDGQLKLDALENMFLDNNQLTGSIPASFLKDMPNLSYLDLTANHLTGSIPSALEQLTGLRYFRAVNNSLTGNLPAGMASLERLDTLALDDNKFSGPLPLGIFAETKRLRYLQLSGNYFGGPLPDSVAGLDKLKYLHISGNQFTGTIPGTWFEGEKALASIRLDGNQLTGNLPAGIGNLASTLEDFRVSENQLDGALPDEMGDLKELRTCKLASNGFSGSIPASWAGLFQLEDLMLFKNPLTGSVPSDLCAMEKDNEGTDLPIAISVDCESGAITCDCCEKCY